MAQFLHPPVFQAGVGMTPSEFLREIVSQTTRNNWNKIDTKLWRQCFYLS